METPKPDKTIDQLFAEFLADQKARLAPKTYTKYASIINLYGSYLESYGPGRSNEDLEAIRQANGTFCGTFGAEDIATGFSEFLSYFMPRKVMAGHDTMKAAGTVIVKLGMWLIAKGYTKVDESLGGGRVEAVARDLPASQKLLEDLCDWVAESGPVPTGEDTEGHFRIHRVGPGQIWLDPTFTGESEIGPIRVPARIAKACKVGWDIGAVVTRTSRAWRFVEVWNLSP